MNRALSRVLILACGNPSRGDDALGPLLIERLGALPEPIPGLALDLLADFQLQIEHALDLIGHDLVVFADAALTGPEPFSFEPVQAEPFASIATHAMSPGAVLRVYRQVTGGEPPDCRLLAIRGYRLALGEPLSAQAHTNLDAAIDALLGWLEAPTDGAANRVRWRGCSIPRHTPRRSRSP
jgi:hydrogenase maturation protease